MTMRPTSRVLLAAFCVAGVLGAATRGDSAPLSNDAQSLAVCQDTIRKAALRLANDVERAVGGCVVEGIDCLAGPSAEQPSCCRLVERGCIDKLAGLQDAKARFRKYVAMKRCKVLPFTDITSGDGLGYAQLAARCAALVPPASLANLTDLTDCLARLIVADTTCLLGTQEFPRSGEALACMGIEAEFGATTGADLATCCTVLATPNAATPTTTPTVVAARTPPPTPTASATATVVATATRTASATPLAATVTPTAPATPTQSATATAGATATATQTATALPTPVASATASATATTAPTATRTATPAVSATATPSATPSASAAPTATRTATASATRTASATATRTATPTATATATPVATATRSATPTATHTATPTVTRSATPTTTGSATPVPTVTVTPGGAAVCGNNVVDPGEDCDDGNTVNCDSCPSNCKSSTAPVACASTTVRHAQKIHLEAPAGAVLSGGVFCIDYPAGVVALPGTGNVSGRVSGITGGVPFLNDFNNAVQLSFVVNPGQQQLNPIISFDLCTGQTAPVPTAFQCVTKSASNSGNQLDPETVICMPTQ